MWEEYTPRRFYFVERIAEEPTVTAPKLVEDPRIGNRFAAFCRKYSIDEMPQLWQVAMGEMALIGPRPLTELEVRLYYGANATRLLSRKPGITGLWQIRGRSSLSYRRRRRLDLYLDRHWSLKLYLYIAVSTIPAIVTGKNAW
jgi:exopolysaccharide production protein ExoY